MNGGDLKWTFNNAVDDASADVNVPLKTAILNYQSKLVAIQGMDEFPSGIIDKSFMNVKVFPIPAKDEINILSDFPVNKIEVFSLDGVLREVFSGNNIESISLKGLNEGVYVLKAYQINGISKIRISKI